MGIFDDNADEGRSKASGGLEGERAGHAGGNIGASASGKKRSGSWGFAKAAFCCLVVLPLSASADITVAVAANLQYAFEEIRRDFAKESGIDAKAVYGASGNLQSQIRAGAPFDVFVSADVDWVDSLGRVGQVAGKPEIYAYGKLVLWTTGDVPVGNGLSCLKDPAVKRIALGDLKVTTYGPAAWKVLEKAGMLGDLKPKMVFGASVGQVAQYVSTQAVQAGFVGKGQVVAGPLSGKGRWFEIPEDQSGRMPQAMAMTRHGSEGDSKAARSFMDFLLSSRGRRILAKFGYGLP